MTTKSEEWAMIMNMSYSEVCAMDDESYNMQHDNEDDEE